MKSLICALIILCSVIISTVFVAVHTDRILSDFEKAIDENITDNSAEALSGIEQTENEYQSIKPFLILFMRENDVKEIEMYIEDMRSAAKEEDNAALTEAKSRLKLHIRQLRRLSAFSMEAIF